jgi:translation initiation factor 1
MVERAVAREKTTRLAYSTGGEKEPEAVHEAPAATNIAIRIRLERRASDRLATTVSGLAGTPAQIAALARELKSACGAGGTVKDGVLELQGDQRDKVEAALRARGLKWKRAGG